jgi:hypothetical protein
VSSETVGHTTSTESEIVRSFYATNVREFLAADSDRILGQLSRRHVKSHASAEADQIRAWQREVEILRFAFEAIGNECEDWWLLLETPLLRLGRRIDAIVLAPGVVGVVEFKIGAGSFSGQDRAQAERYPCSNPSQTNIVEII